MNKTITVTLPPLSWKTEIIFGKADTIQHTNLVKVTSKNFHQLYGIDADIILPDGEEGKTRKSKEMIEDWLIAHKKGRESTLVAIGGGAVLDVVGFTAATYCRGISYISIPTTLLAMCDAAIGGKVGINVSGLKNYLGSFYSPTTTYIDIDYLNTLPLREFLSGMAEAIKHGLINNPSFFFFILKNWDQILAKNRNSLFSLIETSILIKKKLVEKDPYDRDTRQFLNFGHTIGHALESASNYSSTHGEAIARGMIAESYLSMQLGGLKREEYETISTILQKIGPSFSYDQTQFRASLFLDKKNRNQTPHFVALKTLGHPYVTPLPESLIDEALNEALRSH